MKPVFIGLAVVASALAVPPAGVHAEIACYFVPVLGGDSCIELDREDREREEYAHYQEGQSLDARGLEDDILLANAWARQNLAVEYAQATWCRDAFVDTDIHGNRQGWLINLPSLQGSGRFEQIFYPCDANYENANSGGCVPDNRDYDCPELRAWGIVNIPVTGTDWMLLDDDFDGEGCEVYGTLTAGG